MNNFRDNLVVIFYRVMGVPFRLLPVNKKRIVFEAYYGKGFADSPSVIAAELASRGIDGIQMMWLVRNRAEAKSLPPYIIPVRRFTAKELFFLSTAAVWIDNCRKNRGMVKRKGQYYIQTWHGGIGEKKAEKDVVSLLSPGYVRNAMYDSKIADVFLSGSRWTTDLYRNAFWYDGEVLEEGLPRNDIFFHDPGAICGKVRSFYSVSDDVKIALYAPTFRQSGDTECYNLDYQRLIGELSNHWGGKWILLIRMHPSAIKAQNFFQYTGEIMNGSMYPEINELLIACDLLISDYSSCMFDALLAGKKVVKYASDISSYSKERGSYFRADCLPFPLAETNDQMAEVICHYDERKEKERQRQFLQACGSVERGVAAKAIVDKIVSIISR